MTLIAHEPGMHVVARVRPFSCGALRVGRTHLMVGEDQIASAALYVKGHAQRVECDCDALDVPARTAMPQLGLPRRLIRTGSQPHEGVQRISLPRSIRITPTFGEEFHHGGQGVAGHFTESGSR